MKNYFKLIFHVSFFLVISSSQAANFINPPGEPSNLFDGEYIFSHKCFNKSDGKLYKGNYYDGSKFIINKNRALLSLKLNFVFVFGFETINKNIVKNAIKSPNCFNKNTNGIVK